MMQYKLFKLRGERIGLMAFLSDFSREISILLILVMVQSLILPTASWSVGGGPTQSEANGGGASGGGHHVDLATGDFSYSLPVMTVPGPNGGYPISLNYAAGITVDQEASWVGLGWSLGPGSIVRDMRGLPDDFNGDTVTKTRSGKPTVEVSTDLSSFIPIEEKKKIGAFEFGGFNLTGYVNNRTGLGYRVGYGMDLKRQMNGKEATSIDTVNYLSGNLSFSYDSQKGFSLSPRLGLGFRTKGRDGNWDGQMVKCGVGIQFNSKQGWSGLNLSAIKFRTFDFSAVNTSIPSHSHPVKSVSTVVSFTVDDQLTEIDYNCDNVSIPPAPWPVPGPGALDWLNPPPCPLATPTNWLKLDDKNINATINVTTLDKTPQKYAAYGYHNHHRKGVTFDESDSLNRNVLLDFNREKDVAVSKNVRTMPIPVSTPDLFMVSGSGIGGSFRGIRNDIPVFHEPGVVSESYNGAGHVEVGLSGNASSPSFAIGVNATLGGGYSYTGRLKNRFGIVNDELNPSTPDYSPKYQNVVYQMTGEMSATDITEPGLFNGEKALRPKLALRQGSDGLVETSVSSGFVADGDTAITEIPSYLDRKVKTVTGVEYLTKAEIIESVHYDGYGDADLWPENIYDFGDRPGVHSSTAFDHEDEDHGKDHHIHQYSVLSTTGQRYTYGLPVYNLSTTEVNFSVEDAVDALSDTLLIPYDSTDATTQNDEGREHSYSRNDIPGYAKSYLLTQLTSQDYVDLTGNGPSDDDLGGWVKFNYVDDGNYNWRYPFQDANYSKGQYSDELDDMASYTYGKREQYYPHSIETKTHVAIFETGLRADGIGAAHEHQSSSTSLTGKKQRYLKCIKLYSKLDPAYLDSQQTPVPITTVYFGYDYSLCTGVFNNNGSTDSWITWNQGGKLTLREVWFEHNGNQKGKYQPYQFDYSSFNPGYDQSHESRNNWGGYDKYSNISSVRHLSNAPWPNQTLSRDTSDKYASAWNLTQVSLPTGASLDVEYESDEYGHVQDRRSMEMREIMGVGHIGDASLNSGADGRKLKRDHLRIWFKLKDPVTGTHNEKRAQIHEYVKGIDHLYFKAWMYLKKKYGTIQDADDYVTGYALVKRSDTSDWYGYDQYNDSIAFVDVQSYGYKKNSGSLNAHPFRKTSWQHVQYGRSDLTGPDMSSNFWTGASSTVISLTVGIIPEIVRMFNQYGYAVMAGHGNRMLTDKPSYIRLNTPDGRKRGGGHRVKRVSLSDGWGEGARTFRTVYNYDINDSISSGVADYEPLVGGEENPFRLPIWYNGSEGTFQHSDVFVEEPLCESYFPSPRVVYGRVAVKTDDTEDIVVSGELDKSNGGVVVSEFYTSKDFPTHVDQTGLEWGRGNIMDITIPFIGSHSYKDNAYSMGYVVELNDMSGRPKATSTFARGNEHTDQYLYRTEYKYHTDPSDGGIASMVDVLDAHGSQRSALVGVTQEFFMDEEENHTFNASVGASATVNVKFPVATAPPLIVPTGVPQLSMSKHTYRGVVSNKVIRRSGILKKVRTYEEGRWTEAENLLYDAETGAPLLTRVTNEFNDPVYSYNYAAHWAYPEMGGAYNTYRNRYLVRWDGNRLRVYDDQGNAMDCRGIVSEGDVLSLDKAGELHHIWVDSVYDAGTNDWAFNGFDDEDLSPNLSTGVDYWATCIRSGHANLQSVTNGSVVSLSPPFSSQSNELQQIMNYWNQEIANGNLNSSSGLQVYGEGYGDKNPLYQGGQVDSLVLPGVPVCGEELNVTFVLTSNGFTINNGLDTTCAAYSITFSSSSYPTIQDAGDLLSVSLTNYDATSGTIDVNQYGQVYEGSVSVNGSCSTVSCGEHMIVLHADAIEYAHDWGESFPYQFIGYPVDQFGDSIASNPNDYRYGKKGVWRARRTQLYQVDRTQSSSGTPGYGTQIDRDGEYQSFVPFNWGATATNANWDWVSEVSLYNPHGTAVENRGKMSYDYATESLKSVYSASIQGFNNQVTLAAASNVRLDEFGADDFEQNTSSTYSPHGHIELTGAGAIQTGVAHTGDRSMQLTYASPVSFRIEFDSTGTSLNGYKEKAYVASCWVRASDLASGQVKMNIIEDGNQTVKTDVVDHTGQVSGKRQIIDGWCKLEVEFQVLPTISGGVKVEISTTNETTYIDDLRIGPKQSGMITNVYDPRTLWLRAELDGLNYATFYDYDTEGAVIQVRKETEEGIVTISTSRSNTQQTPY